MRLLLSLAAVAVAAAAVSADEKTDRERRVKVALALSGKKTAADSVAAAPSPREVRSLSFLDGYKQSMAEGKPLVVFVGCDGHRVADAVVAKTDTFPDVSGPAAVVIYTSGGSARVEKTFACPVDCDDLQRAVSAAAKKIDAPVAAAPLDTLIRTDRKCTYCDDCQCDAGKCPKQCWVSALAAVTTVAAVGDQCRSCQPQPPPSLPSPSKLTPPQGYHLEYSWDGSLWFVKDGYQLQKPLLPPFYSPPPVYDNFRFPQPTCPNGGSCPLPKR